MSESPFAVPRTAKPGRMRTSSVIVGIVLWSMVLAFVGYLVFNRRSKTPPVAPAPVVASSTTIKISFPSRPLPDFEFDECLGGKVSLESLKGKRWLANFIFTRCLGPCPTMTRDISALHKKIKEINPEFRFVTFTVDPSRDNPTVLKSYAETFQADHDRWKFVTGDEQQLYDLIRGGFMQYVKPEPPESGAPIGFEVAHSNRAVLVNEDGIPVATFLMPVPDDVAKLRRIIEGREEFPEPGPPISVSSDDSENPPIELNLLPAKAP